MENAKVPCSCGRGVGLDEEPYATLALMLRHIRGRGSGGRNVACVGADEDNMSPDCEDCLHHREEGYHRRD